MTKNDELFIKRAEEKAERDLAESKKSRAFFRLLKYTKGYRRHIVMAWIFCVLEVACEVAIPTLTRRVINIIEGAGAIPAIPIDFSELWMWSGITMGLAVFSAFCGIIAGQFAAIASAGYGRNLRKEMYYKIQEFSFANIDRFSTASLVTRMTTDVSNVQFSLQMVLRIVVRSPLMLIFALTMALITRWELGLIFVGVIPFLAAALFGIVLVVHPTFVRVFNAYDDLNASVQENLNGIRVVKSFGREDFEKEKFGRVSYYIYRGFIRGERVLAWNNPSMQIAMYTATLLLAYFGAKIIVSTSGTGEFQVGQLTSMFTYSGQILMSLMMLSMSFVMLTISRNSAERIYAVMKEEQDIKSPENPVMEVADGAVDFDHVHFKYFKDSEKDVLNDIDLHIPSGYTVGIIGVTGSSKTTLISLIARLYDVTEGAVRVGGKDVKEYDLHVLRDAVAVVLQKNTLFTGTIKSNLLWGNENATDEEIKEACHLACADEFIEKLPEQYESKIEEGGTNVSGGQKQRLCIARALLKKPKILILDDSTSAVDTHTDAMIRQAFATKIPNVTKFIIAQRLLSIKDSDLILILDDGKIIAQGTNDELMKSSPVYRELYETQLGGGDFDAE